MVADRPLIIIAQRPTVTQQKKKKKTLNQTLMFDGFLLSYKLAEMHNTSYASYASLILAKIKASTPFPSENHSTSMLFIRRHFNKFTGKIFFRV